MLNRVGAWKVGASVLRTCLLRQLPSQKGAGAGSVLGGDPQVSVLGGSSRPRVQSVLPWTAVLVVLGVCVQPCPPPPHPAVSPSQKPSTPVPVDARSPCRQILGVEGWGNQKLESSSPNLKGAGVGGGGACLFPGSFQSRWMG